ncbi:hypothetical protein EAI89_13065 [Eubacterium sp. am_0171]|nr:hypothetical protein EAI89_13065 [Eubacterium sp. am_0171]
MHSRISRLFRRTGGPAESSYAGFHFDEGTVIPETRIQKSPVTIPYSYIHPTTDFPASWGMRRGQWIRLDLWGKLAGDVELDMRTARFLLEALLPAYPAQSAATVRIPSRGANPAP